ncbi:unnamed protein product [Linum trigynum]|uniref:Retrotransposon Copia-like N-terminal domain-containing protein n=1 Tax=Linum trigynum TaxID=586398 RepID=A0AAV2CZK3_9ROSI
MSDSSYIMSGNPSGDQPPSLATINPAASLPLKLTPTNFPSWCVQLLSLLQGLDLVSYLNGSTVPPTEKIQVDGAEVPNLAYINWFCQDKLLFNSLLASVSEGVNPFITAAPTMASAWKTLVWMYANSSRSRIMTLCDRLLAEKKGDRDVSAFVQSLRSTTTEMVIVVMVIHDDELVSLYLCGLNDDYTEFVIGVRARETPPTIEDLLDRPLSLEADIKARRTSHMSLVTAYNTQRDSGGRHGVGHGRGQRLRIFLLLQRLHYCLDFSRSHDEGESRCPSVLNANSVKNGHTAKQCFQLHH